MKVWLLSFPIGCKQFLSSTCIQYELCHSRLVLCSVKYQPQALNLRSFKVGRNELWFQKNLSIPMKSSIYMYMSCTIQDQYCVELVLTSSPQSSMFCERSKWALGSFLILIFWYKWNNLIYVMYELPWSNPSPLVINIRSVSPYENLVTRV